MNNEDVTINMTNMYLEEEIDEKILILGEFLKLNDKEILEIEDLGNNEYYFQYNVYKVLDSDEFDTLIDIEVDYIYEDVYDEIKRIEKENFYASYMNIEVDISSIEYNVRNNIEDEFNNYCEYKDYHIYNV